MIGVSTQTAPIPRTTSSRAALTSGTTAAMASMNSTGRGTLGRRRLPVLAGRGAKPALTCVAALAGTVLVVGMLVTTGAVGGGHGRYRAPAARSKGTVGGASSAPGVGHARIRPLRPHSHVRGVMVAWNLPGEIGTPSGYSLVYPQSTDPTLCSLDRSLSDRPAAQPLLASARSALISAGMTSASTVSQVGTAYLVSDDPLDPSEVIVAVIVDAGQA